MDRRLACDISRVENHYLLEVIGAITPTSVFQLRDALARIGDASVTVDLSRVSSIDWLGLRLLAAQRQRAAHTSATFTIRCNHPAVSRMLLAAGLDGAA